VTSWRTDRHKKVERGYSARGQREATRFLS
jgi:hypothetical protein